MSSSFLPRPMQTLRIKFPAPTLSCTSPPDRPRSLGLAGRSSTSVADTRVQKSEQEPWVIKENEDAKQGTSILRFDIPQPVGNTADSQGTEPQRLPKPSQETTATLQRAEPQRMISPSPTPSAQPMLVSETHVVPEQKPGDSLARPDHDSQDQLAEQLQRELLAAPPTREARSAPRDIVGDISARKIVSGSRRELEILAI
jgi:hypothetical protein